MTMSSGDHQPRGPGGTIESEGDEAQRLPYTQPDLDRARRSSKVAETVAREILTDIVNRQLKPGHLIGSEAQMLERYRVARGSLPRGTPTARGPRTDLYPGRTERRCRGRGTHYDEFRPDGDHVLADGPGNDGRVARGPHRHRAGSRALHGPSSKALFNWPPSTRTSLKAKRSASAMTWPIESWSDNSTTFLPTPPATAS